jgi:hypothetical protein
VPEPALHIFVCFSSKDEAVAREVVEFLEANGLKCWISLRDVAPGQNYQEAIVQAIETAQGIVFLFSEHSSRSGEIKKELSIGASINVPVFPVRLAPIAPSGALRYELSIRQWIDIFPNRTSALGKLAETIKNAINAPVVAEASGAPPSRPPPPARPAAPARSTPAKPRAKPREPIVAAGSKEFESIRALLARHIGPIAKVFIEKAATEAKTPAEFCERLAAHISVPTERNVFLKAVQAQLAAKS